MEGKQRLLGPILLVIMFALGLILWPRAIDSLRSFTPPVPDQIEESKPTHLTPLSRQSLYLPGDLATKKEIIEQITAAGINTVIIDIKTGGGQLTYPSTNELAQSIGAIAPILSDLKTLVDDLHRANLRVVARQVVFWDNTLSRQKPELRVPNQYGRSSQNWVDPSAPLSQDYNIAISVEAITAGIDEIQYDYIRFPTDDASGAQYQFDSKKITKSQVIANFLQRARTAIEKADPAVDFSADIFGIAAWDIRSARNLGREITVIAPELDLLYPMLYPSHFHNGFDGYANPADYPEYFITEGVRKLQLELDKLPIETNRPAIIPWLQGFSLKVTNYSPDYIAKQITAAQNAGVNNYAFWNNGKLETIIEGVDTMD